MSKGTEFVGRVGTGTRDNTKNNFNMVWSQRCKIAAFVGIATASIVVLIIVLHVSRLCENKDDLFYRGDQKCHRSGYPGPCNRTLVLLPETAGSQYGDCSCENPNKDPRSLLYDKNTDRCYFVFTKGWCEDGDWLNVTRSGEPYCTPNRCLDHVPPEGVEANEIVPMKGGKCGVLGQFAKDCKGDEKVAFIKNRLHAGCAKIKSIAIGAIGIPPSQCPLGSSRSIMGKCQPDFEFDFK